MWGEASTQERWGLPISYMGGWLNTETMVAFLSALALQPHNSVSPCMFLVSPEKLFFAEAQGE